MVLTLVRHTTPDIAEGICYGQTDLDVAVSFEREASGTLVALPAFDAIITSPLMRCQKLADLIASRGDIKVEQDARLMEIDFGSWEGRAWSEIPRIEIDAWAEDFWLARPHGGESVSMLHARAIQALWEWQKRYECPLIVTHAGIIKAALSSGHTAQDFNTKIDFGGHVSISTLQGVPDE